MEKDKSLASESDGNEKLENSVSEGQEEPQNAKSTSKEPTPSSVQKIDKTQNSNCPEGEATKTQEETKTAPDESEDNKETESADPSTEQTTTYDPKDVHYEGDIAVYTDPNTGTQYEWHSKTNEWRLREVTYTFESDTHVYTDKDGVKYFWDKERKAWFPKVDDDFMARYQMSYGFVDNTGEKPDTVQAEEEPEKTEMKPKGEKRKASEPTWFDVDEAENTKVYVSNLPTDITEEEFVDLMQKCGLVMRDPGSGNFKIKLYREPGTDYLKGDALCTYIKIESVELALSLLDGSEFKGHKLKVERAKFQMKGQYDPKLKPKMKKRKEKMRLKKIQEKLFDWRPEKVIGERAKHEKVVIVKNLFEPSLFDTDVGLILEFQQDLREEVSKIGVVRKVILYDRHPEGVAQINMSAPEEADEVVKLLNGRWFMKRQLTAEIWDGRTKFKIAETDAEITERIDKWDKFLEDKEEKQKEAAKT